MKLTIVTETFPPEINGVALTFRRIARELARRGHDVTVVRPYRGDAARRSDAEPYAEVALTGVPIPWYPQLRLGLPARGRLRRRWSDARPDLVHVVTEGPLGASAVTAARELGVPVTSSFHTNFHVYMRHYQLPLLRRTTLAWLRRVHNRTARTFAPTPESCAELAAAGFRDLRVLSRGVDIQHFSPARRDPALRRRWGVVGDAPVVLHAGRMAPEKNYNLLFRAFNALRVVDPRCRFILVGDGPLRAPLQRAYPDFLFTGFIRRDELAAHYASADLYVHASLSETFGNVLTEALASGLAVAAFDYAAARLFIRPGENGLLAPVNEPDTLIAAAVRLASDPGLRARLRAAAPAAVAHHTWAHVIDAFEAELYSVAGFIPRQRTPQPAIAT